MRTCDNCDVCCVFPRVPELSKPERTACVNCTGSRLCSIYEDRPNSCRNFECMWLQGHFRDEDKPSISGVMVENHKKFIFAMCDGDEWKSMMGELDKVVQSGTPVVIGTRERTFAGMPNGTTEQDVIESIQEAINGSGYLHNRLNRLS